MSVYIYYLCHLLFCSGYGANLEHVHDSSTDTFYLFMAIHLVSGHGWR